MQIVGVSAWWWIYVGSADVARGEERLFTGVRLYPSSRYCIITVGPIHTLQARMVWNEKNMLLRVVDEWLSGMRNMAIMDGQSLNSLLLYGSIPCHGNPQDPDMVSKAYYVSYRM